MAKVYALTKKELGQLLHVHPNTIRIWLNYRYFEELQKLGYQRNQRVLLPKQVEWLIGTLDIDL